jgi:aryl-alcohol dehydrogenase-like predicted oxidoreductase
MYSLVKRQVEVEILPLAAAENLGVMTYSPLGGGLLTGKYAAPDTLAGRIRDNAMYARRYGEAWVHDTAAAFAALAREAGWHPATLAIAWAARHPAVTAPIIGARSVAQLQPALAALDRPLPDDLYARVTALSRNPAPATDRTEEA